MKDGGSNKHHSDVGSPCVSQASASHEGNHDTDHNHQSGDTVIHAIARFMRSPAHPYLEHSLYRVDGTRLTPTQVDALEVLASRDEWRTHEFAAALQVNPSSASRSIDRLAKLDLAEREVDITDRRYVLVRTTHSGQTISNRIQRDRYALMQEVMASVSDQERTLLADLLDRVVESMEAAASRRASDR